MQKKLYSTPVMREIGSLIKYTKSQGTSTTQDNGQSGNPRYS